MSKAGKAGIDKKKYDRIAGIYDIFESPMEVFAFSKWRNELFSHIQGKKILEVGIGTGKNLPYYREWNATGIDISRKMIEKARRRAERLKKQVDLVQADAEMLPFRDESFDGIISTYVFCSVENPENGLKEIFRVLKPRGKVYFLEHVRSENEIAGKIMDTLNPIFRLMGPEINRRTVELIKKTGLAITKDVHLMSSVFRLVIAEKPSA